LDTHCLDTPHLREQGCVDPWLYVEAKRSPRAKSFGKHSFNLYRLHLDTPLCCLYTCISVISTTIYYVSTAKLHGYIFRPL